MVKKTFLSLFFIFLIECARLGLVDPFAANEIYFSKFFSEQCSKALKSFLAGLPPKFKCNFTPYITLPAYASASCSSKKKML